jgi:DNA repair protein RecO (recombination protein O)
MALITDEAFVISSSEWKETSIIVRCYTREHGKLGIIAKGIRRPKSRIGSPLETFSRVKIVFFLRPGADLATLKETDTLDHYPMIRQDLVRFGLASFFFEILDSGVEVRERHPELYDLISHFLTALNRENLRPDCVCPYFLFLARELGFSPRLDKCALCPSLDNLLFFDPGQGRTVCSGCKGKGRNLIPLPKTLRDEMIKALSQEQGDKEFEPWPREIVPPFFLLIERFIEYHLEKKLKSADFLLKQIAET